MDVRFGIARVIGAVSTWMLKGVFRRPAANFPGKVGLYADPGLLANLRPRMREGSIVVAGTNGKTTVANLIANALQESGKSVACNRTGANLDSGVATALLQAGTVDWGVLECDELWLGKVVGPLRPRHLVLVNLFRDQLDRMGEIDHIQESIVGALLSSPGTTLVYNCDDPLCQAVADKVANEAVPFGIAEDLALTQNAVADASICQRCDRPLEYRWRQYGQLGAYRCPQCGFSRAEPAYAACGVSLLAHGVSLTVQGPSGELHVRSGLAGAYSVYNLLAACAAADCCGAAPDAASAAAKAFAPDNGRLQRYEINGREVLLNLAKNPAGLNQNLRIVEAEPGRRAVAFFINDKEADGHDVSWLWDADFQELACCDDLVAFAGGIRRNDVQVRLKHAGLHAPLVEGAADFMAKALDTMPGAKLFLIANYTALPDVKAELDELQRLQGEPATEPARPQPRQSATTSPNTDPDAGPDTNPNAGPDTDPNAGLDAGPGAGPGTDPYARSHANCVTNSAVNYDMRPHAYLVDGSVANPNTAPNRGPVADSTPDALGSARITIVHLYPELLNLYGDGGNVVVLENRARGRGIRTQTLHVRLGDRMDLSEADIVFLGGGPDREQRLASHELIKQARQLRAYVEDDGVLLAICGGFQILGKTWILGNDEVEGLGILDMETRRADGGSHNRLVGNIVLESPLTRMPVVGYENHAGRTFLGPGCQRFGSIVGHHGKGNNGDDGSDGAIYRNVVGTYLHGPLLAKNPEAADWLIERALTRQAGKADRTAPILPPLDDTAEVNANAFMCHKLGIHPHSPRAR